MSAADPRAAANRPSALLAPVALLGFAAGVGMTVVELAAARALAPHFGQSIHVWAAVIGVLLCALAAGYARGARVAERGGSPLRLVGVLLLGAAWLVAAAFAGPALCRALLPEGLPTAGGLPIGLTGSVLASVVLFALPVGVLGGVSPWLVRALDGGAGTGRGAGFLYAAGTLGSLLGCVLTPLFLLQTIGTRATLLLGAALLALLAAGLARVRLPASSAARPALPEGGGARGALAIAFLAGFVTLAAELLAVRLFSPWCGQSNRIWASTIGVILFALALGSWFGERLARARPGQRPLMGVLVLAGLTLLPAAFLGPALAEQLVPRGVDSMRILPVAFSASLALTTILFGLPTLLLGAVAPLLVHQLAPRLGVGIAAGRVSAWGTLGALAGTFAGPLLLVPGIGSRLGVVALAAALLLGVGLAAHGLPRLRLAGLALGAIGMLLALLLPRWTVRVHPGQLTEIESAYQTVRAVRERVGIVVPDGPPSEGGSSGWADAVFLRHDEDAETYQSIWLVPPEPPSANVNGWNYPLSGGRYYEQMALGARLALPAAAGGELRVLIIGYAGGGVHRTLRAALPVGFWGGPPIRLKLTGVEIDPAVVETARAHLDLGTLETPNDHEVAPVRLITGEDARTVVNALPAGETFHLVLVDAYARTNYIPFQLATKEFFDIVRKHLAPRGWVGVNVLGSGLHGPVCRAVADTLEASIGPTYLHPNVWFPGSVILWAAVAETGPPRVHHIEPDSVPGSEWLHHSLEVSAFALERLTVRHRPLEGRVTVLTDDLSPSDRLADEELGL